LIEDEAEDVGVWSPLLVTCAIHLIVGLQTFYSDDHRRW